MIEGVGKGIDQAHGMYTKNEQVVLPLTKATVGGVPLFSLLCLSHSHEWHCTPRMNMVKALVPAQLRSPLHC